MDRKIITVVILSAAGLAGVTAVQASAETVQGGPSEVQMFASAPVKLDQAGQIALKTAPGELAAIGFNDENGTGVYEASVVGKDGTVTVLKIDAQSGKVLGTASGSSIGGEQDIQDGGSDGEQQDG
ncbi:MAG: PepSY domain-containing protein [Paracoccaceae bacterium]|nr:PepSY domain-containing protein [Paracoccaceae bacterium]